MNVSDIVQEISESCEVSKAQARKMLDALGNAITRSLIEGESAPLPGLGTLSISHRAARVGRNPQTGEPMEIKAARVAKFRASKALKEAVQEEAAAVAE